MSDDRECRCGPGARDPYACEDGGCNYPFSEMSPFGGGGPRSAEVVRACPHCGWRTTPWHVDDGSAEADLHDHIKAVHQGVQQ